MEDKYCRDSGYDVRDHEVFMMGVDRQAKLIEWKEAHQ